MPVGAAFGITVTLGAYFAISSLGDRGEDEETNLVFTGSLGGLDQEPNALVRESTATKPDILLVDGPIETLWSKFVADERPDVAQLADLVHIAKEWIDESGFVVIQKINDSLTNSIVQHAVIGSVMHHAAQTDADSALQHALQLTGTGRDLALSAVIAAWVNLNPFQAMQAVSAIEEGSVRRQLLEMLVRAWAENDPKTVLEDLAIIPANLRKLGEREAALTLARTDPEGTVTFLGGISDTEDTELKFMLTLELASSWSDRDPSAALEWALSSNTFSRNQVLTMLLGKLARVDPRMALQTALSQPIDNSQIGLELSVIGEVAATDHNLAYKMLSQVRGGLTRKYSYQEVGKALIRNNEPNRALNLALDLPTNERRSYYNQIVHQWARSQPKSLIAHLENLPSIDARIQAATSLMHRNTGRNTLTETQMDYVRNFLPDDYNSETK